MPGSPRKERGEFPLKATGTQKARPTNRGKARRYKVKGARFPAKRGALPFVQGKQAPHSKAAATKSLMAGLCAGWRRTGPDVLNDLPTAVWLTFEDDYVAAFGGDFSARGDGG
jgi:hypothetical protein